MLKLLHTADLAPGLRVQPARSRTIAVSSRARGSQSSSRSWRSPSSTRSTRCCGLETSSIRRTPRRTGGEGFAKALTVRHGLEPPGRPPSWQSRSAQSKGPFFIRDHPFRQLLPAWVHVVDCDGFELTLGSERGSVCRAVPIDRWRGRSGVVVAGRVGRRSANPRRARSRLDVRFAGLPDELSHRAGRDRAAWSRLSRCG